MPSFSNLRVLTALALAMTVVLGCSGCIDKEKVALKQELDRLNGVIAEKQSEVEVVQRAIAAVPMETKRLLWNAGELTALEQHLAGLEAEIERWKVQKQEAEQKRQAEQKKIDDYRKRYANS